MRLTGCSAMVALLIAALVSARAQAPLPHSPAVQKLATTLRGSGCSAAGIETGDPTKGPSIIVEKFAPGCAISWHWHTPNEHVMMVSGTFRFEIQG
jgi:quercetin dioxygenase-like cupin family protein